MERTGRGLSVHILPTPKVDLGQNYRRELIKTQDLAEKATER